MVVETGSEATAEIAEIGGAANAAMAKKAARVVKVVVANDPGEAIGRAGNGPAVEVIVPVAERRRVAGVVEENSETFL